MNDGREIIIVFYTLFKVVCQFRYSKGHRVKKKVSTILKLLIYFSSILKFLKLLFYDTNRHF